MPADAAALVTYLFSEVLDGRNASRRTASSARSAARRATSATTRDRAPAGVWASARRVSEPRFRLEEPSAFRPLARSRGGLLTATARCPRAAHAVRTSRPTRADAWRTAQA